MPYFESDSDFMMFVPKSSDLYISGKIELFLVRKTRFCCTIGSWHCAFCTLRTLEGTLDTSEIQIQTNRRKKKTQK